ncbi:RNA-binding cell elongation regulator Jag/EloR [Desulfovibrio ferrophilus]|uniref:RNA-binding protein KhpB n=1 Tax=Desulfovibrio ferrophilus TaxID=241368 RepID=A0A2Z6B0V3_9BACT|nr:RNA-binding cell elongation regulator Jag/EloR [Desulfovibrio ferrophilus]BBD09085.1 single-stranded nucleic acid binding R3H domain protein [Desulfovibrio ferrophilus]
MSEFKEFTGKGVDDAIEAACTHFALSREKLEIEIISGGSAGIFGLMGKKKAVVRAKRREKRQPFADLQRDAATKRREEPSVQEAKPQVEQTPREEAKPRTEVRPASEPKPRREAKPEPRRENKPAPARAPRPEREKETAPRRDPAPEPRRKTQSEPTRRPQNVDPRPAATPPDAQALEDAVREVLVKLLEPIVGETKLVFSQESGRLKVLIDDEPNSGLIIGREGQTITALQYITNRIVARKFQTSVRVHLDAGDYRDKQDDNLRKLALYLADKAKNQGRTQSTKPLSSYHRRLVHLALQDDASIATRSKGEGPLKRVLIYPANDNRRGGGRQQQRA